METPSQRNRLTVLGVERLQGYLISPHLAHADVPAWLGQARQLALEQEPPLAGRAMRTPCWSTRARNRRLGDAVQNAFAPGPNDDRGPRMGMVPAGRVELPTY